VATVPKALCLGPERRDKATSDKFAISLGPADGEVVTAEVFPRRERVRPHAVREVLVHIVAQDGFAQSARAAVNQNHELLLAQPEFLEFVRVEDFTATILFREALICLSYSGNWPAGP
jgi:hypothetical protein